MTGEESVERAVQLAREMACRGLEERPVVTILSAILLLGGLLHAIEPELPPDIPSLRELEALLEKQRDSLVRELLTGDAETRAALN